MTVHEFRREIEHGPGLMAGPTGIETLTVRADRADIAALLVLIRSRLVADSCPSCVGAGSFHLSGCTMTVGESALRQGSTNCTACGATFGGDLLRSTTDTNRCQECVAAGYFPVDEPS